MIQSTPSSALAESPLETILHRSSDWERWWQYETAVSTVSAVMCAQCHEGGKRPIRFVRLATDSYLVVEAVEYSSDSLRAGTTTHYCSGDTSIAQQVQ
jgi:hypothetical protein